ncbi:MAG: ISL3 family transposase [Burkholderiales bacterium]|nr:ISL3 family transposase [Burkholderiales bacterium]
MSTSLLYHAFGIVGYFYQSTRFIAGIIIVAIQEDRWRLRCPACRSRDVQCRGKSTRRFRTVPIGGKAVFIDLPIQRVECAKCQAVRQVKIRFADEHKRYTRAFERLVLDLSKYMTIKAVSRHLGVNWDLVKGIQKNNLNKRYRLPKLARIKRIAIDEIYQGKKLGYLTIVMDLQRGAVIFVGNGKGADALTLFWKRLKKSGAQIEAVATDMGPAYISAVKANLPEATLVFDHFHIIKLFNEKLTKLRRDLQREAENGLGKPVLKGIRWLLLKNPDNLDDARDERQRLDEALKLNEPLATAYYMKEELRDIWHQPDKDSAQIALDEWIKKAAASNVNMLKKFSKTLAAHRSGILAYFDFDGLSTGPLEGTNNKIKTLHKMAYGFRDAEFFKLKIMALHEANYALGGTLPQSPC